MIYQKFLYKIYEKPLKLKFKKLIPIKTIFRTFTYDGVMEGKKQKYKLYKMYK
jgi:flagellar biosynthesis protein FlhB